MSQESVELERTPFQHEDDETFTLRVTYEYALLEAGVGLEFEVELEQFTAIASMVVKKARYGVVYEDKIEEFIDNLNRFIKKYYDTQADV